MRKRCNEMKKIWIIILAAFLPITAKSKEIITYQVKKELFGTYYEKAEEQLKNMSLEEKVGQLFLARMNDEREEEIKSIHPGGYVLFAKDFENKTKEMVKEEITKYQGQSKIPLILAVDEEGGTVTRVSRYKNFRSSKFPSNRELYQEGGFEKIEQIETEKIALLKELGLNLNLAPVADISTNINDYMYKRSLGQDKIVTSEFIQRVVKLDNDKNFASCLKHFPGYGNNVDTHTGIAIDNRAYASFTENDYLPFQAGIKEGVPAILVSHNIITALDETMPSSLSKTVHKELREKLEFTGLIITDDLIMDAIKKYKGEENSAVLAVLALNDLIITSNLKEDYEAVLNAVKNEKIDIETIDIAVRRIIAFKYQYHII